jgi:ADP-heptose:LPS heptosyltransferase
VRRLIIRPGAIGDFIVSLPALESLRAQYTEVWTTEANRPLAHFASATASIYSTGLDVFGLPERPENPGLIERLRRFDSIVSWYGAGRPDFRAYVQALGLPFEFHRAIPPSGIGMHAVDYYLAQVNGGSSGAPPDKSLVARPRIPAQRVPLHATVIHPFSASPKKNWPMARFRLLAEALAEEKLGPVLWCAGPEDNLPGAVRVEDLGALAEWLSGARLYIGNDSGISHLAAAVGVPVVALFGPTDPDVWAPRGPLVRLVKSSDDRMESIGVGDVVDAVREIKAGLASTGEGFAGDRR